MPQGPLSVYMDSMAEAAGRHGESGAGRGNAGGNTNGPVDLQALAQAHCHTLAGACLALGLKYAGSCNAQVCEVDDAHLDERAHVAY